MFGVRDQCQALVSGDEAEERLVQSIETLIDQVLHGRIRRRVGR
jgi:hypothetical protein